METEIMADSEQAAAPLYPRKADFRQRAHCNPLSFNGASTFYAFTATTAARHLIHTHTHTHILSPPHLSLSLSLFRTSNATDLFDHPTEPTEFDTAAHYPAFFTGESSSSSTPSPVVEIADVGCGFGGLLIGLSPLYPRTLIMGMEIRAKVTEFVRRRILAMRAGETEPDHGSAQSIADKRETAVRGYAAAPDAAAIAAAAAAAGAFNNISVLRTNAMKFLPCYFARGQLRKIFFCFPDPHFKAKNHRRRIVTPGLLDEYVSSVLPTLCLYFFILYSRYD